MLFLLFIVLPVVELALLIRIGARVGALPTLALVIGTGMLGAALARRQGLRVLRQVQAETQQGRMPGEALTDGVIILMAAILLMSPGVLTDVLGILCLIPVTRRFFKALVWQWFERRVREGQAHMYVYTETSKAPPQSQQADITAEYEVVDEGRSPTAETQDPKRIPGTKP